MSIFPCLSTIFHPGTKGLYQPISHMSKQVWSELSYLSVFQPVPAATGHALEAHCGAHWNTSTLFIIFFLITILLL